MKVSIASWLGLAIVGSEGELQVRKVANLDARPKNCTHDMYTSQVTEATQETEINIENRLI